MRNFLTSSAIALAAALPTTHADARPMTEQDLVTLKRIASPDVSPDGKWVVYQQTDTDPASLKRSTGLRLLDLSKPDAAPATIADTADANESSPAFAPAGDSIFYLSGASGSDQVWRIDPRSPGAAPVLVTDFKADVAGFRLSPDGRKLLVWGDIANDCPTFGCDSDGNSALPGPGTGRHYRDGAGFVRHWDSWETPGNNSRPFVFDLVDGKAANGRAIAPGLIGDSPSKPFGGAEELAWSADSASVFFTLRKADRDEPMSTNLDIYRVPADASSPPENLTAANAATDTLPAASPDGKWLAYVAMARPTYEADRQVLMLRDLKTGAVSALTHAWDRSVASIAWARDSKSMIVTAEDVLQRPLFSIDLKGKVTRLTGPGSVAEALPLAKGGIVYALNSVNAPSELFHRDGKGMVRALSKANDATLAAFGGVTTTAFSFAGADGATVWGQITKPAGATGKLPVAFMVHGGPQGTFGNGWSHRWNPRIFAEQGYAVVTVDFHGSTGYGQAFTDAINQDWGGKPLTDLQLGLAAAAAQDAQVDPGNACALGASYGGYMMNWIAGQWPGGFKCLVTHAGVFDLRAMAYQTEEQWFDEWDHGGPWWTRKDAEKWNPVNHVTDWRTPALIIHGEKDFRIPYTQSLSVYQAMQRRGIASELLIFPDENHWITKPKNSIQWHTAVFDWLARHLKK
jgi:dipeptidyl aminopeptidase/acylaminoacyl peptidase